MQAYSILRNVTIGCITFLFALFLFESDAQAADYDVRRFNDNKANIRRIGPNLSTTLQPGTSYFMGVHFRQQQRHSRGEPGPLMTVADSQVGGHRYMRLEVHGTLSSAATNNAVNFVAKTEGLASGSNALAGLSVGGAVSLNQWYAAGALIEAKTNSWQVTVYRQVHGGALQSETVTTPVLNYTIGAQRINLYSSGRHAFVTSPTSSITDAHQYFGDVASPVWVLNPSEQEIENFMARSDPSSIWSSGDFLVRPHLGTLNDMVDNTSWTVLDPADFLLIGALSLGSITTPDLIAPSAPQFLEIN